jgi:cell wall-associated NlpC family hydrolase
VRRLLVVALVSSVLAAPALAARSSTPAPHEGWAKKAIATVTSRGIFAVTPRTFRPADPLTAGTLESVLAELGGAADTSVANPKAPVTIEELDAAFVGALGLGPAADNFQRVATSAGLAPPARFGTEAVARFLGLRTDLPIADDAYELQPQQVATRADAAWSAARVISLGNETAAGAPAAGLTPLAAADAGGGVNYVQGLATAFALPALTPLQQEVLRTPVSLIGYPYVWGGQDEHVEPGFDCSGLVWRTFKLVSYPDAPGLTTVFAGRTAAAMAGEVSRSKRIGVKKLEPGDVVFFGLGPRSKPAQIGHTAIYLGNGWIIEASGQGVSLGSMSWYTKSFAWARRPLAEAGLEPAATTAA